MDNTLSFGDRVANLLILGSGQYGAIAHEIVEAMGHFGKIDFLDDNDRTGLAIGKIKDVGKFAAEYGSAIPAVGAPDIRRFFIEKIIV